MTELVSESTQNLISKVLKIIQNTTLMKAAIAM
jgi:hypothetical protein